MHRLLFAMALAIACGVNAISYADQTPASADRNGGSAATDEFDFPPGAFSDGGHYRLSDFRGKVLVLYFYDSTCPTARGLVPERNELAGRYKGKPVLFIGVAPHTTLAEARAYDAQTHLAFPTFADSLGVMEQRFKIDISLQDIYQTRIIDGTGKLADSWDKPRPEDIDKALKTASWKYNKADYSPRLSGAIDLLEWNQFEPGMRMLRPYLKKSGAIGDSAQKLDDVVKTEAGQWADEAKECQSADPGRAYDLYTRLAACFSNDALGKNAAAVLMAMKTSKPLRDELAARQMYDRLYTVMPKATDAAKAQVIAYCNSITAKYPDTATGKRAKQLADDLQAAPAPHG